nr:hypothetical protein [Tanacetum cinerariifolium]
MGDRNRSSFKSKEDQIQQLSKTVYVTNFPNHIRAQDLWNVCKDYGSVVDVYIPFKKESKPTFYAEHNHANIRKKIFVGVSHKNSANTAPGSYAFAVKKGPLNSIKENEMKHALVLDESCYIDLDFSLSLLGKVNEFSSLSNLNMVLDTEGFTDITIKYMGGVWVLISFQSIMAKENLLSHVGAGSWFSSIQQASDSFHTDERVAWIDIEGVPVMAWSTNTFTKITSKWGDLLYEDDKEDSCFHRIRVCIKTKMVENIFGSFKIIVKGKVYWTRVKEVIGWSPDFMEEEDTQTESDNDTIQSESDEERIPETVFENVKDSLNEAQSQNKESIKAQSEDPFNIYDILNKKHEHVIVGDPSQTTDTLKYPPGFTPYNTTEANSNHDLPPNINSGENTKSREDVVSNKANHKPKEDGEVSTCSGHFQKATTPRSQGSFLQFMEELVKVGHTMGGLVDVPMRGCSFTWVHKSAAKMSKLDRFVISEGLMESCPNISAITLDRYLSDHRPILLRELCFDYGPAPFRFYHYWFELEDEDAFVDKYQKESWLIDIDKTIDARYANSDLLNNRKNVITSLLDMEKLKSLEVAQKAKIKWSIEDEFLSHFKNRFDFPSSTRLSFDMNFPNQISSVVEVDLEKDVSLEELKMAVWDCGIDKSPGPDGFTFGFYQRYWSLLEKDVIEVVSYFFQHGLFPKVPTGRYVVPTGKVIVATGRHIVPA